MKYKTILADPPWAQNMSGKYKSRHSRAKRLPYETMTINEISTMPVKQYADEGCHLWLWTTNQFLRHGYKVVEAWGFTNLVPIHWIKPSGLGNYFVHRTQTLLFGYYKKCQFPLERYLPNIFYANVQRKHSRKPNESYELIEKVSPAPRLELFARPLSPMFPKRDGWDVWGNEVDSDISMDGGW